MTYAELGGIVPAPVTARIDLSKLTADTQSLPEDFVRLTARRLGIAAAIAALAHLVYLVLYRTLWSAQSNVVGMTAGLVGFFISAAVATYLLFGQRSAGRVAAIGVAYEIFLSFDLAVSESWAVDYAVPSQQVPWATVIIVLFPFLIPARPRVILASSLASAATTPLALALMLSVTGKAWPSAAVVSSYALPPFIGALMAWAPTNALYRLRSDVQQARRLGSYELTERLGQGGMGEVWRANHRLLARPAAVKLIKAEMLGAKDAESRERLIRRFEQEAQVTASLESPHTVELYDFGVSSDGALFYVMELLRGVDLDSLIERFGPQPPERVVHILMQACDSLEDAHNRGLIHRDIKPANLFVARKGGAVDFLKVLDFGLVRRWDDSQDADLVRTLASVDPSKPPQTAVGQIVGTPAFLAPEAALGESAIDRRVDIYALGCVAYWMLTGTLVFDESTAVAMAVAHVTKQPEPPSRRTKQPISPELERVVMDCLQKDRESRPSSAERLREELARVPLARAWTRERATDWWREHLPE